MTEILWGLFTKNVTTGIPIALSKSVVFQSFIVSGDQDILLITPNRIIHAKVESWRIAAHLLLNFLGINLIISQFKC